MTPPDVAEIRRRYDGERERMTQILKRMEASIEAVRFGVKRDPPTVATEATMSIATELHACAQRMFVYSQVLREEPTK